MTFGSAGGASRSGTWAWLGAAALLAGGAVLAGWVPRAALDWRPELALHEPWRAWSAAFVHLSPRHLGANLAGCTVVAVFGAAARVPASATLAWLVAWPLTHVALALEPRLNPYAGLSGVLHAGVAIAAWHLVHTETGRRRSIGALVLAGLVLKLWFEAPWAAPTQRVRGWDFPVAPWAHASGAVAGLVCAWLAATLRRRAR